MPLTNYNGSGIYVLDVDPDEGTAGGGWALNTNFKLLGDKLTGILTDLAGAQGGESGTGIIDIWNVGQLNATTCVTTDQIGTAFGSTLDVYASLTLTDGSGTINFHGAAHHFSGFVYVDGILAGDGIVNARLAADVTTTSAAATDTGLSFAVGAGQTWTAEFNIRNGCSTGNGVKFGVSVPAGATLMATVYGASFNGGSPVTSVLTASGSLSSAVTQAATQNGVARVCVTVVNSTTAGTVKLQVAANTAGDTATVAANSYFVARRIA